MTGGLAIEAGWTAAAWDGSNGAWPWVALFGLCLLAGCAQLARPNRLVLTPTGFEAISWRRTVRRRWTECGPFQLWKGNQQIVYATSRTDRPVARLITRAVAGVDGNVSASYRGILPTELVALMNDYQAWALQHPPYGQTSGSRPSAG